MVMKRVISRLVGLMLLFTSCSDSPGPTVNLVTVKFQKATALETTATFTLRLSNEAPEARQFTGSAHKIYINDLYVGKGLSDSMIEVPRLGTVTQDITVHLSNLALATRLKSIIENERFDYRIQSVFYGKGAFGRLKSETEGKLDLKDFTPNESTNAPTTTNKPAMPRRDAI